MATVVNMQNQAGEIPTAEELVDRARAMIPALKSRAKQCTAERNVPAETISEMQEAGFFKVLQPKRMGGYEMHPNVFFSIQKLLAEGCMSTGWVYGVLGCHPYEMALFDDKAQQEVWGDNPSMLVSSTYQPVGKVEHAEGGFYLSGHWGFSSGSVHCGWVLLGALVFPEDGQGPPDMRTFLLPREDYEIDRDSWQVFGLQGTGSHDIIVDRVFVPEYRTHRAVEGFMCDNPGQKVNEGPLYSLPWAQVFVRSVSTAAFGGARAAVNAAMAIMESRISTNTGKASKEDPMLHGAIAAAHSQMLEMELTQKASFDELMELAESGKEIPMEKRSLFAYQSSTVVRRLARLVDDMMQLLGGRAIYTSSDIIQPWLDLNAARAHVANDPSNRTADVVGTMLGQPPVFTFM
ncbi:MAG: acyl-CoA dehydrogenase family protein [Parasphingorhabdus sp.]|uniref:acyl-CoA dehydrogenase family protein n=2 Tax=Parasphingorhabdus sp. TaxID=2709688 RepID=UPI003267ADA2